ncbi:MAG: hypothetical protein HFF17_06395 [Oscillospiraceae bacterium]|nr:hypothetical protein [Oscillospiraceae bacterium]
MGELSVRRNRGFSVPRFQAADKTEKATASGPARRTAGPAADTVSETLRQLMGRVSQAERQVREGRRTLQAGEGALAETADLLARMESLAKEAAGESAPDRAGLQRLLEQLRGELERIVQCGVDAGLFDAGEDGGGLDALVDAVMDSLLTRRDGLGLPAWLALGLSGRAPDREALLAALGVDSAAGGAQLLLALGRLPLEDSPAAGYLAALYLGAVIAGGAPSGSVDPAQAAEGLRQLLELAAETNPQAPLPAENSAAAPLATRTAGNVQAAGRDLGGLSWDARAGTWIFRGGEAVTFRTLNPAASAANLQLAGEGPVTLHAARIPLLDAAAPQVQARLAGENTLAQVRLASGTTLTLDGSGVARIGALRGDAGSVLRLHGGAVQLPAGKAGALTMPVVVDGPASLLAAAGSDVRNARGEPLEPLDILWKTLLPDWRAVTALAVDGRQSPLQLRADGPLSQLRLWLWKGSDGQGYPAYTIVLWGRDEAGALRTRYTYVRWDRRHAAFQPVEMYPNPFTVTGGEADTDWRYEEETQTLRILTSQVTALAGGAGTDANQTPFSGRIVLEDSLGAASLTLEGVTCRVTAGRAFGLGRENDVTLLLRRGTENIFESGTGCAGISLGAGTSLLIDQTGDRSAPDGVLNAAGGTGGAGIGRDRGAAQGRPGLICIRGGAITAVGSGGGAGIGGALGAPAGDIRIQGGRVRAEAACCAAAIGAGIQGACGDIAVTGSARIVQARGNIGGCLFGGCGKVQVSPGTNLVGTRLWTQRGLTVQMGEASLTLPRFQLSARALRLDGLSLATREAARSAVAVLAADRRLTAWLQGAYGAMHSQLGQSLSGLYSVRQYLRVVRDTEEAGALLLDVREVLRSAPSAAFLSRHAAENVDRLLR